MPGKKSLTMVYARLRPQCYKSQILEYLTDIVIIGSTTTL